MTSSTNINILPNELLLDIFNRSDNFSSIVLVCKRWKALSEQFHSFNEFNFFTKARKKKEYEILLKMQRNFMNVKLVFNPNEDQFQINGFLKFMEKTKVETTELHILKMPPDTFHLLLKSQQNIENLKIYCGKAKEGETARKEPIKFENLKTLELTFPNQSNSRIDDFLNYIETPQLSSLKIRSRNGTFLLMANCLNFVNRWSEKNLKLIDIEFEVRPGHVLTFYWSTHKLVFVQCYGTILEYLEQFTTSHAEEFKHLKTFNIYVSTLSEKMYRSIAENAVNLEVISTDHAMPVVGFKENVFPKLRMMKMWAYHPQKISQAVHEFHKSFPNIQTLLIYEFTSDEIKELLLNSCRHLNHFRHGIYPQEYFNYDENW